MRILKSAPANRDFYNEHGASLTKYNLIGLIGQTLSGLSLAYAVFALIVSQTQGNAPPTLSIILAVTVGVFVELANRVLARPAIRPYVVKDLFADTPDLRHRHTILNRSYLSGLVAVALLSYGLSAVGSTYYSEDTAPDIPLVNTDSIKAVHLEELNSLAATYAADTAMTATPYNIRLNATRTKFIADSSAIMAARSKYLACAEKGNVWCKGNLVTYSAKIDTRRAELADSIGSIVRQKAAALAVILTDRKKSVQAQQDSRTSELSAAEETNTGLIAEYENETNFQGLIFIILTVAGQTVFYFMVYLTLQVEAGSEIEYSIEPNEFWNLPSTLAEWKTGLSWRTERYARAVIRTLYEPKKQRKTDIPYKGLFDNASGHNATQDTTTTPRKKNGKACTPTRARTRTQDVTQPEPDTQPQTQRKKKAGEVGSIEQCEQCNNDYTRKTTRQRFCSDNCRLEHHATKHNGKRFDAILNGTSK